MSLAQMSFSGAVLILVIVLVRALLIHKLPKKTFLALWAVVLLRLLVPFSVPSSLSVYTLAERYFPAVETAFPFSGGLPDSAAAGISSGDTPQASPDTDGSAKVLPNDSASMPDSLQSAPGIFSGLSAHIRSRVSVWTAIWAAGFCLCLGFFLFTYLRCLQKFQMSLPVSNETLRSWYAVHPMKRKLSIRQLDRIASPLTYGVFRPVILLPKRTDWADTRRTWYVLEHEYVHIQHFDTLKKLTMLLALCIHWFNPLVWVMYILFNRDIELSCDETVIRRFGENTKSSYAMTLICMEEEKSGLTPLYNSFSKNAIEERIQAIMKIRKITFIPCMFAVLLVAGIAAAFATSASTPDGTASERIHKRHRMAYSISKNERFNEYEKFGLSYDSVTGYLMYDGKTVGYFKDEYEPGTYTRFTDEGGELSVVVIRNDSQEILSLQTEPISTREAYEEADISEVAAYDASNTASSKDPDVVSDAEGDTSEENDVITSIPPEYAAFGISLDRKTNIWMYRGKGIAALYDKDYQIYTTDSIPEDDAVYLEVERDASGAVTRLKEVTREEMQTLFDHTQFYETTPGEGVAVDAQ